MLGIDRLIDNMSLTTATLGAFTNKVAVRLLGTTTFTTAMCDTIQQETATYFGVASSDVRVFAFNPQDQTATSGSWNTAATSTNASATTSEVISRRNELNGATVFYPGASLLPLTAVRVSGTTGLPNLYASAKVVDPTISSVQFVLKITIAITA